MAEIKLEYTSDVKDGQLQRNVREKISRELFHFEGKRVVIKIEKLRSKRSNQQNRYWWALMTILSTELGYDKNEIHEICKFKFLKREVVDENTGLVLEYLGSTADLNKSEFADMTSDLIRWAAENFNIVLPLPGEQTELYADPD